VADELQGLETSPYRYHRQSGGDLPTQSVAWDPLDFLTLEGPGWDIYMAAPWTVFSTAPAYGSRLQNRVWNFREHPGVEPDAMVFHFGIGAGWQLWYLGRPISPQQVSQDPRYELVSQVRSTQLWVRRVRLQEPRTHARLAEFYRRAYAADIRALRELMPRLPVTGALITSTVWGHALKYLAMTGELPVPVHLVPAGEELAEARRIGAATVLTAEAPLAGAEAREFAVLPVTGEQVSFFINAL
jgi:hypothetical protein